MIKRSLERRYTANLVYEPSYGFYQYVEYKSFLFWKILKSQYLIGTWKEILDWMYRFGLMLGTELQCEYGLKRKIDIESKDTYLFDMLRMNLMRIEFDEQLLTWKIVEQMFKNTDNGEFVDNSHVVLLLER
jgi:hypothetical protein